MKEIVKRYSNGEVTVVWKPAACIHSARCFRGLPAVFDPRARPWVKIDGADTDAIVRQVALCPSGALSTVPGTGARLDPAADAAEAPEAHVEARVQALPNGPLLVTGDLLIERTDGTAERRHAPTAFCRCGGSANKPFCDGTHARIGFRG